MTVHTAIPTIYRGIQMRSRLEAKWACVFDQLGWTWEYEPFDLKGWMPDFVLHDFSGLERCFYLDGLPKKPILVEVKPLSTRLTSEHDWGDSPPSDLVDKIEVACGAPQTLRRNGKMSGEDAWDAYFDARLYDVLLVGDSPKTAWLWQKFVSWWFIGGMPGKAPDYMAADWQQFWATAHNETQWKSPR